MRSNILGDPYNRNTLETIYSAMTDVRLGRGLPPSSRRVAQTSKSKPGTPGPDFQTWETANPGRPSLFGPGALNVILQIIYPPVMHTANRAKFLISLESRIMRTVRNITVAVEPELYRQTRKIAADYNTTVTDMVRFLLLTLPEAVKAARYPGGAPQFGLAAARAARAAAAAPPAAASPNPPAPSLPANPSLETSEISPCTSVNAGNPHSLQKLARQQPAPVQVKHFSIATLKAIISKALRAIP